MAVPNLATQQKMRRGGIRSVLTGLGNVGHGIARGDLAPSEIRFRQAGLKHETFRAKTRSPRPLPKHQKNNNIRTPFKTL